MASPAPPPRRTVAPSAPSSSTSADTSKSAGGGWKARAKVWGGKAAEKGLVVSDKIGFHANNLSQKFGGEAFWPVTGDFPQEVEKCIRILKAFTVDGVAQPVSETTEDGKKKGINLKKQAKVFKKIPASVIRDAKAIVVYASQRMGTFPLGGSGGSGLIVARLPDGSWSAPSAIAPGNFSAGAMFGLDLFEAVLVIRTQEALETFYKHSVTLGSEISVSAGHYGTGGIVEAGKDKTAIFSYVRSRGFYVGLEAFAQLWFARFDENERVYGCMGVTQEEILKGHFRPTPEAIPFLNALVDAETGRAQRMHGEQYEFEQPFATKDAGLPEDRATAASGTSPPQPQEGQETFIDELKGPTASTAPVAVGGTSAPFVETEEKKEDERARVAVRDMGPPPALPPRQPMA
ncbi:hypothetical protein JCM8547_005089 [Rhodosporidiobolus lusitaniae]